MGIHMLKGQAVDVACKFDGSHDQLGDLQSKTIVPYVVVACELHIMTYQTVVVAYTFNRLISQTVGLCVHVPQVGRSSCAIRLRSPLLDRPNCGICVHTPQG